MNRNRKKQSLYVSAGFLSAFLLWTLLVRFVDVEAIGPNGAQVGLATLNGGFHRLTGTHMTLYTVTDWLGLVPVGIALGFAACLPKNGTEMPRILQG